MIFQKSFYYADLVVKKNYLLLSMLQTDVLLNILVETVMHLFRILWRIESCHLYVHVSFNLIYFYLKIQKCEVWSNLFYYITGQYIINRGPYIISYFDK